VSVPGYRIPVHQSLTRPLLLAGVPRTFAILNGTAAAAIVLGLHNPWVLPLHLALHVMVAVLTHRDVHLLEIVVRQMRSRTYYRV